MSKESVLIRTEKIRNGKKIYRKLLSIKNLLPITAFPPEYNEWRGPIMRPNIYSSNNPDEAASTIGIVVIYNGFFKCTWQIGQKINENQYQELIHWAKMAGERAGECIKRAQKRKQEKEEKEWSMGTEVEEI